MANTLTFIFEAGSSVGENPADPPPRDSTTEGFSAGFVGMAVSLLLHALAFAVFFSARPGPSYPPEPLRVSWVEFAPIGIASAVEKPEVLREELSVQHTMSRLDVTRVDLERSKESRESRQMERPAQSDAKRVLASNPLVDTPSRELSQSDSNPDQPTAGIASENSISGVGVAAASEVGPLRASYESLILGRLERAKRYPTRALQRRLEGEVLLAISISANGQVLSSAVQGSSGHELFDTEALKMVSRAAPFPALPSGGRIAALDVVVPIAFKLR